jgi:hypothetical protein
MNWRSRPTWFLVFCAISLGLMVSCEEEIALVRIDDPGRIVVPTGTEEIMLAADSRTDQSEERSSAGPELRVRLPDEYIPSQAVTINLNLDDTDEQIVVFKRRDDLDDRIRMLVVVYDPIRNSWIRAWEGVTRATSTRSFTVYTEDLTGDHERELVAFGINERGEQTLDVFRRTNNALGFGLSYSPILSISADVDITVESVQRSKAYENMEVTNAPSFPIIAERRDPESSNVFETIQTTYYWDFPSRQYVAGRVESIAGDVIEDDRLRNLYAGTEEEFERFLSGPWYRSSGAGDMMIAYFGPFDESVVFYSGSLQQAFDWKVSTKTVYGRGMTIAVTNSSIKTVNLWISVSVESLNGITIAVQGTDGLSGVYERLTGSLQQAVLDSEPKIALAQIELSGLYRGDSGREIVFGEHEFTERREASLVHGGFVLFSLGNDLVLTLKEVDNNRLPVDQESYRVGYEESQDETRITRTLVLEPGEIGLAGFFATGGDTIVLEQIEQIEDTDEDESQSS